MGPRFVGTICQEPPLKPHAVNTSARRHFLTAQTGWNRSCYQRNAASVSSLTPVSLLSLSGLSTAKRKFAESLNEFKFQCIGDAETDDEICIGG